MDRREPVQVSFQLPAGTLEGLSRLVEQLRLLAAEVGGGAAGPAAPLAEYARNEQFDSRRYEALRQTPDARTVQAEADAAAEAPVVRAAADASAEARTVRAEFSNTAEAPAVRGGTAVRMEDPERAADAADAAPAGTREAESAGGDIPPEEALEAPAAEAAPQRPREDPPAVRAAAESPVEDPPAVRMDPESRIPAAEAVWAGSEGEGPAVRAVEASAPSGGGQALSAGFAVAGTPEAVRGRWDNVEQELAAEGPAPLTAEAVSLAFRRDGRRYDNGFPLY